MNYSWPRELFNSMHPDFFKQEYLKSFPEDKICEEMILFLSDFDVTHYEKNFPQNISFGLYDGDLTLLQAAVAKVSEDWVQYFTDKTRVYCGFIDGKVASFCIVDDMGIHEFNG